jgi:hypothetical protein
MLRLTVAAVALSLAAAPVIADPAARSVRMTDAQLDQVTAGAATSIVVLSNPGNASVSQNLTLEGNHATCINCAELAPILIPGDRANGVHVVINRGHPATNPIIRCVGAGVLGLC